MALWNSKDLVPPPIMTCKCEISPKDLETLKYTLSSGIKTSKDNKLLLADYTLLQRIIYRLKTKFRSSKDMKSLSKLQQALRNYFCIDTVKYLAEFSELLPENTREGCLYLPTRNLLDFMLVRLQGLSKLLERMYETCKIAASDIITRIKTGNFWKIAVICLAVVSRICMLSKATVQNICDLYNKLQPYTYILNNTSFHWLPKGYTLPKDLREWINVKWIDEDFNIVDAAELDKPKIIDFFNLVDSDEDLEICDEYVLIDENNDVEFISEFKNIIKKHNRDRIFRGFNLDEDSNEVIDLSEQTQLEEEKQTKTTKLVNSGGNAKNILFRGYIEEEDIGEEIVHVPEESNEDNSSVVFIEQTLNKSKEKKASRKDKHGSLVKKKIKSAKKQKVKKPHQLSDTVISIEDSYQEKITRPTDLSDSITSLDNSFKKKKLLNKKMKKRNVCKTHDEISQCIITLDDSCEGNQSIKVKKKKLKSDDTVISVDDSREESKIKSVSKSKQKKKRIADKLSVSAISLDVSPNKKKKRLSIVDQNNSNPSKRISDKLKQRKSGVLKQNKIKRKR